MNKAEILKSARPITRKWLYAKLQNAELTPEIQKSFFYLNTVEGNIINKWHQNVLRRMVAVKLHAYEPELFEYISKPEVTVIQALAKARKSYAKATSKQHQKQIAKIIAILQQLFDSEKELYDKAGKQLSLGNVENVLENIAAKIEAKDEVSAEYLLYTKQSIKHYNRLRKLNIAPSIHELYQALDPRFAGDPDIYTKQISIVLSTYHEGEDVDKAVKDICFDFIKDSIKYCGYIHVSLMEYIFKNDEISERAYQLFCDAEKQIRSKGMSILPAAFADRLAKKKGLDEKPKNDLTDAEIRILKIKEMFS